MLGHNPLILLTKFDIYCKNKLGLDDLECYKSNMFDGLLEEATEELMKNTNNCLTSKNFILFAINYTGPFREPDKFIEFFSLYNMKTIKDMAISYLKTFQKNCVLIYNAKQEYIGFNNFISLDDNLEKVRDQVGKEVISKEKELGSFSFIDSKNEEISKDKEKKIKLIDISFTTPNCPFKSIKINIFKEIEEKPKPIIEKTKNKENMDKITKAKAGQEEKQEILITLVSINQKNEKEEQIHSVKMDKSLALKLIRKDYIENCRENFPFTFLDANFKKIEDEDTPISEILTLEDEEYYIYVKLLVFTVIIEILLLIFK